MNPRLARLQAEHAQVQALCEQNPRIRLISAEGSPPERYVFEFSVIGLTGDVKDVRRCETHRAEVFLLRDYPRRPPFCRMLTPVFHPNIDPQKICIGDHWSAGQKLTQIVVRIGEMITYQSYNVKSPLNAEAAMWAEMNEASLPLEPVDLTAGL